MQQLLSETSHIREKYRFFEEKTGAKFNVYSVAHIERREEIVHSRMIAELLNPKGSHGQGIAFLQLFLGTVFSDDPNNPDKKSPACEEALVEAERSFSIIDGATGRIDIIIELKQAVIVIENKIDAPDQKLQMARYRDYAKSIAKHRSRNVHLFYLTPDGREPSESSLGDNNQPTVDLLTYPTEIAAWLDQCMLFCVKRQLFFLIEGIGQYRRLIDKISGNTMSMEERKEIDQIFEKRNILLSAKRISDRLLSSDFRGKLIWNFLQQLQHRLELLGFRALSIDSEKLTEFKAFAANENAMVQWCERKKEKEWECKGIFLELSQHLSENYLCHVMFATDALHYGLMPRMEKDNLKNLRSDWARRDWPKKKLVWWSYVEKEVAYKFEGDMLELLVSPEQISALAMRIHDQIVEVILRQDETVECEPMPSENG